MGAAQELESASGQAKVLPSSPPPPHPSTAHPAKKTERIGHHLLLSEEVDSRDNIDVLRHQSQHQSIAHHIC